MTAIISRPVAPGDAAALARIIRDTRPEFGPACYDANPDHLLVVGTANCG